MYHLKATLYVTVCLAGFVTKTYGEQKSWPNFYLDLPWIAKDTTPKKNNKQIGFRVRAKTLFFLGELLFKEIVAYDISVNVSVNFVNMRGVNPLDFSVSFKHTVLPFFASFGRSLRELLPRE